MSSTITFNGTTYSVPATGDENWSDSLSLYLIAIASGALQKTGGTFTLTAETDFGATYGLKSTYYKSRATNPSSTGIIRLGNNEGIGFRNAANGADLVLKANASDILEYNGNALLDAGSSALTGLITNTMVSNSAAIAYSKLNLGTSIVNADVSASAAIAYSKLNLGTSIVNADISTSAAIAMSKLAALTTGKVLQSNASTGAIEASSVSTTTLGYLDATSSVQTQLDARIAKSLVTTKGDLITATASATPARQAIGSDGQVLVADSTQTNGIKWATANSGSKNYFIYNSFENNATTGWSLGTATLTTNFPSGTPTFGSGASGNLSLAAVSGSPIAGTYALSYASSAATTAGDFVASDAFTIDAEDMAKPLAFKFSYKAAVNPTNCNWSGTTSNSFGVAIYDVTNSAWIQPAGCFNMVQSSGVGIASGSFQTSASGTSYRICVYNANATSGAATVYMDSFFVGPQTLVTGAAMTDWISYTPTVTGFGTLASQQVQSRRVGDSLEVRGVLVTGTPTAVTASVTLGFNGINNNVTADTSKIGGVGYSPNTSIGTAWEQGNTATFFGIQPILSSNTICFGSQTSTANPTTINTGSALIGSGATITFSISVPIVGWSSNVQLSSDTDTREVTAIISGDPASATSGNPIIVPTVGYDSHGGYNASTGRYTCPVSGRYKLFGALQSASSATTLTIYKNAASTALAGSLDSNGEATFCGMVSCIAGDIIDIRPGGTVDATSMTLNIERTSGPSVIAASESVHARYGGSTTTLTNSTTVDITFTTKEKDTHNAFNGTTFTVPVSGTYQVVMGLETAAFTAGSVGATCQAIITKNGSDHSKTTTAAMTTSSVPYAPIVTALISCIAGDTLKGRFYHNLGATPTLNNQTYSCYISFTRVGN